MKNHGKKKVRLRTVLDGKEHNVEIDTRNVYEDHKGGYWISWGGDPKGRKATLVMNDPEAHFDVELVVKSLQRASLSTILGKGRV